MTTSNQEIARQAATRLSAWIDKQEPVPLWRGKPNRARICKIVGITRSTVGSNGEIKRLFLELEQRFRITAKTTKRGKNHVDTLHRRIAELEDDVIQLRVLLASYEYLFATGTSLWE
ncbi:hypothetical protein SAMN05216466_1056 [Paraburkholderia phenazinium]|jgi:hypothetical protein|uniref:Transposase n=1 Tax=Paraburkholderia phenazinium TaxID=60549 RepID=A0A1G7WQM1_9BURK|nr:hypothetical protein [Paraburkholderia phenazinium]SDG74206.1 hypothetical protein SAMN05216466_1056 [Paraburkholderia phenazinium]